MPGSRPCAPVSVLMCADVCRCVQMCAACAPQLQNSDALTKLTRMRPEISVSSRPGEDVRLRFFFFPKKDGVKAAARVHNE